MKTFYTSDYHLGHYNIIKYANRPFKTLDIMNTRILANHNSRVNEEDTVYHIGDFCFKNSEGGKEGIPVNAQTWLSQLNGNIVHVRGNHDRGNSLKTYNEKIYIKYGGIDVCLVHKPSDADFTMRYNFVGHVHDRWKFKKYDLFEGVGYLINVGVDQWNYMPVTFEEIMRELNWFKKTNSIEKWDTSYKEK
jgi:calcineurin-like phosphoesterase family protein